MREGIKMEELDLLELLRYYLKKSPFIILIVILALLLGFVYTAFFKVPLYHGQTTIILVQNNDNDTENALTQGDLNVNEKLVSTYSEIMKSRRVLSQVISSLRLDITSEKLARKISVASVNDTSIIKIIVSDEDSIKAANIANSLANIFMEEISQIYKLENIKIIDEAIKEINPYNINIVKQMVIYGLIAFVLSCAVIFVIYYFDNTIKTKKEIETKLNLPVLGEIPLV